MFDLLTVQARRVQTFPHPLCSHFILTYTPPNCEEISSGRRKVGPKLTDTELARGIVLNLEQTTRADPKVRDLITGNAVNFAVEWQNI